MTTVYEVYKRRRPLTEHTTNRTGLAHASLLTGTVSLRAKQVYSEPRHRTAQHSLETALRAHGLQCSTKQLRAIARGARAPASIKCSRKLARAKQARSAPSAAANSSAPASRLRCSEQRSREEGEEEGAGHSQSTGLEGARKCVASDRDDRWGAMAAVEADPGR